MREEEISTGLNSDHVLNPFQIHHYEIPEELIEKLDINFLQTFFNDLKNHVTLLKQDTVYALFQTAKTLGFFKSKRDYESELNSILTSYDEKSLPSLYSAFVNLIRFLNGLGERALLKQREFGKEAVELFIKNLTERYGIWINSSQDINEINSQDVHAKAKSHTHELLDVLIPLFQVEGTVIVNPVTQCKVM